MHIIISGTPGVTCIPGWSGDAMDPVRRPFGPADLAAELGPAGVAGTVLVQTVSDMAETREFLDITPAPTSSWRCRLGRPDLARRGDDLDALLGGPAERCWSASAPGARRTEPTVVVPQRRPTRAGRRPIARLTYDLLVVPANCPAAAETAAAYPDLRFVLDHIGKPRIADGLDEPWRERMPTLAQLSNVSAKLSGM